MRAGVCLYVRIVTQRYCPTFNILTACECSCMFSFHVVINYTSCVINSGFILSHLVNIKTYLTIFANLSSQTDLLLCG